MIWTPDICAGNFQERCRFEWEAGDTWTPEGKWSFLRVCSAHAKYSDDISRLKALKIEQEDMSESRNILAKSLNLKYPDGSPDLNGDTVEFAFDEDRNIKLTVPEDSKEKLSMNNKAIDIELSKITSNISIE